MKPFPSAIICRCHNDSRTWLKCKVLTLSSGFYTLHLIYFQVQLISGNTDYIRMITVCGAVMIFTRLTHLNFTWSVSQSRWCYSSLRPHVHISHFSLLLCTWSSLKVLSWLDHSIQSGRLEPLAGVTSLITTGPTYTLSLQSIFELCEEARARNWTHFFLH